MSSLHIGTLPKIIFKNLTGPLYIQLRKLQNTEYKTLYTLILKATTRTVLYKKVFLQILQISHENTSVGAFMEISIESLLKKVAGLEPEDLQLY